MRITFLENGTFRLEADPSGSFTDPANTPQNDPARTANIVVGADTFDGADVSVTMLARGVPVGGELDWLDDGTIAQAMRARRPA